MAGAETGSLSERGSFVALTKIGGPTLGKKKGRAWHLCEATYRRLGEMVCSNASVMA